MNQNIYCCDCVHGAQLFLSILDKTEAEPGDCLNCSPDQPEESTSLQKRPRFEPVKETVVTK